MMQREEGLALARIFKKALQAEGIPVQEVVLFGSVARNEATEDSDIDIAVLCTPFKATRHEENMECRRLRWNIDPRIEPYCFHKKDFENKYFGLAQEIKRTGVEV